MAVNYSSPAEVLDLILDRGITIPQGNICCPDCNPYVLASVETFLKYAEAVGGGECCYNISASLETYLKFAEAIGVGGDIIKPPLYSPCGNNDAFAACLTELSTLLSPSELIIFLDKGLVELGATSGTGGSYVCILVNYLQSAFNLQTGAPFPVSTISELISRIQDKGIVISCVDDNIIMGSVEAYLRSI